MTMPDTKMTACFCTGECKKTGRCPNLRFQLPDLATRQDMDLAFLKYDATKHLSDVDKIREVTKAIDYLAERGYLNVPKTVRKEDYLLDEDYPF